MKIAEQFGKELQDLLDRYKNKMTTPDIMRIAQPIFAKTIGIKENPECFKEINGLKIPAELLGGPMTLNLGKCCKEKLYE